MIYLFQVTVYSALLYVVYLLLLKNRASHGWNRFYLLVCATLPLVIPFIKIAGITASIPVSTGVFNIGLPEITIFAKNNSQGNSLYTLGNLIVALYLLVVLAILLHTMMQYFAFRRFVRASRFEIVANAKVLLDTGTGPGSFGQYVFLPGNEIDMAILAHELAHIRLKHSSDILLLRVLRAVFWPNIALYAITSELKIVHEFQADAYAAQNKTTYISTLLNDTFGTNRFSLPHTFFYHPLKRRIMMLQKSPLSRKKLRMAIVQTTSLAILLFAGVIYLQSCKQQPDDMKQSTDVPKITHTASAMTQGPNSQSKVFCDTVTLVSGQKVYTFAGKMPKPPYDLIKYLSANIKYPEDARKKVISGKVVVKFIIDKDGSVINPVIMRSVQASLDAEALRVIKNMPKWTPGEKDGKHVAVYFMQPISFAL